jgi:hypothetical protein
MLGVIAAVLVLGSPVRVASGEWSVPVYLRECPPDARSVTFSVEAEGVSARSEAGTLLAGAVALDTLDADTLRVKVEREACAPVAALGVVARIIVTGRGSITLRLLSYTRSCDGVETNVDVLQQAVQVPPEQPVWTRHSTWARVKREWSR